MAVNLGLLAELRRQLAKREDITERRMMGSVVFLSRGNMVCGAAPGGLMLRLGPDFTLADEPELGPMEIGGRRMGNFARLPLSKLGGPPGIARWLERAFAYTDTLPTKVRAARPPKSKAAVPTEGRA